MTEMPFPLLYSINVHEMGHIFKFVHLSFCQWEMQAGVTVLTVVLRAAKSPFPLAMERC